MIVRIFIQMFLFLSLFGSLLIAQPSNQGSTNSNSFGSDNESQEEDGNIQTTSNFSRAQSTANRSNRSFNSNLGEIRQLFSKRVNNRRPSPVMKSQFLENNSVITQTRKTGKISELTRRLSAFGLSTLQTNRFFSFSKPIQKKLIIQSVDVLKKLLDLQGFNQPQALSYFNQSPQTRAQILSLSDNRLLNLLNQDISPGLLSSTLTPEKIASSQQIPSQNKKPEQSGSLLSLGEKLRSSGNARIYEEILELSGGTLTPNWQTVGETANVLLQDYDLSKYSPSPLPGNQVLQNPFYSEISSLYGNLLNESLLAGSSNFIAGRNLVSKSKSYNLSQFTNPNTQTLIFSSSESFQLSGQLNFNNGSANSTPRVVHMSGDSLRVPNGVSLSAATSDLVLAARKDILLKDTQLEGSREVAIRSLRDINLNNLTMGAKNMATIRATQDLNVNGLRFSQSIPSIIMEANTLRLSDVHFPASSAVRLNSLKGGIDGRYPNFGTAIPAAQQIGRVNFIKNVTSGGNPLNNRTNFNQFGGNITIGKLPRP